jgi:hypothetical protein
MKRKEPRACPRASYLIPDKEEARRPWLVAPLEHHVHVPDPRTEARARTGDAWDPGCGMRDGIETSIQMMAKFYFLQSTFLSDLRRIE